MYKWNNPREWLEHRIENAGEDEREAILREIMTTLDFDTIQDIFEDSMDNDGYFEEVEEDEEVVEYEELMGDYLITEGRGNFYEIYQYGKLLDQWSLSRDAAFEFIKKHMATEGIYPNVFYYGERGDMNLLDSEGNYAKNPLTTEWEDITIKL